MGEAKRGWSKMSYEAKPHHRRYYMPSEVAQHCTPEDCWLSWFGNIYDLSPLLQQHQGIETKPIIDSAGQDITHWFDADTADVTIPHPHANESSRMLISSVAVAKAHCG